MSDQSLNMTEAVGVLEDLMDDNGFIDEQDAENFEDAEVTQPSDDDEEVSDTVEEEEASDEQEEDEEQEDEDEESESEEDQETEEKLFEIEIDGETYEVNEEELLSGYLRNEQLVKRQSELEAEYQEKTTELEQHQVQLLSRLEELTLEGNLALQKYKNVNWEHLKQSDPESYRIARLEYIEAEEEAKRRNAERDQLRAMHAEAQKLRHEAYLKTQFAIAEKLIPEIKNEEFVSKLVDYGKSIGFTEQEIQSIGDAKVLFLMNQARLYAESQVKRKAAQEKVSKDLPPVIKPGVPRTVAQEGNRKVRDLQNRLKSTNDLRDAARLLEHFV